MDRDKIELLYGYNHHWIEKAMELFNKTEMKRNDQEKVNRAFQKSQIVASVWSEGSLLAIGRMITDFEMYSAIFDVVVDPLHQKKGLGKKILLALMEKAPNTSIHLTSTFGNEAFYLRQGFKFHRTAMAHYPETFRKTPYLDWDRGFE